MATVDLTNITPPRVPLIDPRTGLISREWYRFFLNLFQLTGSGQNTTSLTDLQLGPPPTQQEDFTDIIIDIQGLLTQPVADTPELQAALDAVRQELQTLPPKAVDELQQQINDLRQEVQTQRQPDLGSLAALQQDNVPWLIFDTTPESVPTTVGTLAWDGGTTLNLQATTNVIYRLGEAQYTYVKASAAITKGQLCYHTGAVGSSGVVTAAPTPIGLTDPNQIIGVAAESIPLNGFGLIQDSGDLKGFDTTGSSVGEVWADGDPLYYNPAYVGSMTKVKPSAPNIKSYVGEVINAGSGGSGSMSVRMVPGSVLGGTDSNVQFGTVSNGDLIQYDSTLGYWKNVPASTLPVGTATNLAGGLAGSVPYQTAPSTTTFLGIGAVGHWLGSSGTAPQWNAPAALTKTDDTNVTLTLGGSASTALLNAASLTLGWTGQLAVSRGGTGVATATANTVFAGPTTGGAAAPSFRALVAGDIPALSYVSSVGATAPITSTGGLTPTIGVTAAALTKTDDTNVTLTLGGSPTTALLAATSLTLGWTGTLAVSRGGTGTSTAFTAGSVVFAGASGVYSQNNTKFFWDDANSRLGIGTATPAGVLESIGTNGVFITRSTKTASTNVGARFMGGAYTGNLATAILLDGISGENQLTLGGGTGVGEPATSIRFNTGTAGTAGAGTQRAIIDSSGNVGIGTSSPSSILHAKSTTGVIATLDGSGTTTGAADTGAALMFNGYDGVVARNFVQISAYKENSTSGNYASYLAFNTRPNGGSLTERARITSTGNIYGTSGTTGMTDGFFYIPAAAGVPTGTPTAIAGRVPMYYDTTNNNFYVYNGAWKKVALT